MQEATLVSVDTVSVGRQTLSNAGRSECTRTGRGRRKGGEVVKGKGAQHEKKSESCLSLALLLKKEHVSHFGNSPREDNARWVLIKTTTVHKQPVPHESEKGFSCNGLIICVRITSTSALLRGQQVVCLKCVRKILETHPDEVHNALTQRIRRQLVPLTDMRGICKGSWRFLSKDCALTNSSMALSQRAENFV